jgi:hypothetical protein
LSRKLKVRAIACAGKKHVVFYFGSKNFGYPLPSQMLSPFGDHLETLRAQKVSKGLQRSFEEGIAEALEVFAKPKEERLEHLPCKTSRHPKKKIPSSRSPPKALVAAKGKPPAPAAKPKAVLVKAQPAQERHEKDHKIEPEEEEEVKEEEVEEEEEEEEEVPEEESEEAEFDDPESEVEDRVRDT